ncbi:MAG: hypothetical protein QM706_09085 [Nitrospira sp.]
MFPLESTLTDGVTVQLSLAEQQDVEPLKKLYQAIVDEGNSYPHDQVPDHDEFMEYWFRGKHTIVAYAPDKERTPEDSWRI